MKRLFAVTTMALGILSAFPLFSHGSEALDLPNPGFEEANADQTWPEGWPTLKQGGQYGTDEDGNRFLRMTASEPGKMTMLYREIAIPEGVDALELKFRYRLHDFKRGSQSWFDARIMMEFMDAARNKVSPNPPAPNFTRNQGEWKEVSKKFLVPDGARILKFMPCLFNVQSGSFDLDDISLTPCDGAELRAAAEKRKAEAAARKAAQVDRQRARASETLEKNGTLIANGSFTALKGSVEQSHITALRERLTALSSFYLDRTRLKDELDLAQALLERKDNALALVKNDFQSRSASAAGDTAAKQTASALQPLGITARAGATVAIYAELPGELPVYVVASQFYGESVVCKGSPIELYKGRY